MGHDDDSASTVLSDGRDSPYIDAENERIVSPTSAEGPSQQRLTARASGVLRGATVRDDGTPKTWRAATSEFQRYIMSTNEAAATWTDEMGVTPTSHRFSPDYAANKKGRICGGFRYICEHAPPSFDVKTVLVTLEGWPYDEAGRPAPPVEFLDGLNRGRTAMFARIRRQFEAIEGIRDYGYVTVREPHTGARQSSDENDSRRKGYPHTHVGIAVLTDAETANAAVKHPIRAALDEVYLDTERGNPFAREEDHGAAAVTVRSRANEGAEIGDRLAEELSTNLIGYEFDFRDRADADTVYDVPDAVCRFAALLWATERRSVMLRGGSFREWVDASQANYDPPTDTTTDDSDDDRDNTSPTRDVPRGGGGGPEMTEPASVDVAYEFPTERDG